MRSIDRISSSPTSRETARVNKKNANSKFSLDIASSSALPSTSHVVNTIGIDPLFSSFFDDQSPNKKEQQRGQELLDHLEQIKKGLVLGLIPQASLNQISKLLKELNSIGVNEELKKVMREIEARTRVELAKIEMIQKNKD